MAATAKLPIDCPECGDRIQLTVHILESSVRAAEETHVWRIDESPIGAHMQEAHPVDA
jgi:hypothetical protein